jgi:hypothetical protein
MDSLRLLRNTIRNTRVPLEQKELTCSRYDNNKMECDRTLSCVYTGGRCVPAADAAMWLRTMDYLGRKHGLSVLNALWKYSLKTLIGTTDDEFDLIDASSGEFNTYMDDYGNIRNVASFPGGVVELASKLSSTKLDAGALFTASRKTKFLNKLLGRKQSRRRTRSRTRSRKRSRRRSRRKSRKSRRRRTRRRF